MRIFYVVQWITIYNQQS